MCNIIKCIQTKVSLKQILCFLVLIIFVVEMLFAVERFADDPTMFATETVNIMDLPRAPIVTICPAPLFDYGSALKMGYTGKTSFFAGKLKGKDNLSWTGDSGKSYEEVIQVLWAEMLTILQTISVDDQNRKKLKHQPKNFMGLPMGVCKTLVEYNIGSKRGPLNINMEDGAITVFITDPATELYFKTDINSMHGSAVHLKVTKNKSVHQYYKVTVQETHLREGRDGCMNYGDAALFPTYYACVEEELKSKWLPAYGCLPPWMSRSDGCNATLDRNPDLEAIHDEASNFYVDALYGYNTAVSNCLLPCIQTSVETRYFESYDR